MDKYIGRKLDGRYDIQEIIGVGGMAVVYKAYDSIEDRTVAVKILKDEFLSNEEFRRRFKNESKAIAVLSHTNIVKVFDVSFSEELQYIVEEYIDGITLKEYIDQQKVLTWKETVHFTIQILKALAHAHEKGIVHRDIKPQNIMLLSDGTIKVTDFGIARFAHSETKTMTEKAIGSVHYISPEQARGDETDDKTDIYSVGVMMYEMLTGRLPFEADSAVSVAIMQMQTDPKKLTEINESIPEGLEDITLRAMQKEPAKRYQSAMEMLEDLEEFKQNPSIHFEYQYFVDDNPTKYVDSIDQVREAEPKKEKAVKKKKKSTFIPTLLGISGAVIVVIALIVFVYLFVNGIFPFSSNAQAYPPNLKGLKYADVMAQANTKYKDFVIKKASDKTDTSIPAGVIISQAPTPDIRQKIHSTIYVVVSTGYPTATIPDVYNKDQNTATSTLAAAGFTNIKVSNQYDANTAKGSVINTDPPRGTVAAVNTAITIYISNGAQPKVVTVPNVVGEDVNTARNTITTASLAVGNVTNVSSTQPKGTVIWQSISGSQVTANTPIDLHVSLGPVDVNLPVSLPNSSTVYNVNVQVAGKLINNENIPFTTYGGNGISISIPGGTYTGTQDVQIIISGGDNYYQNKLYKEMQVNFDTGKVTRVINDNSKQFTAPAASSSVVSSSQSASSANAQ